MPEQKLHESAASFSLVACRTEAKRQVSFLSSAASHAMCVFSCPLGSYVFLHMLCVREYQKVFNSVVERIAVYMMDVGSPWGASNNPVFVIPYVWFCDFYKNVDKTFSRFYKAFGAYRASNSHFRNNAKFGSFYSVRECFTSTVCAARRVLVRVAVFSFLPNNLGAAKWA